MFFVFSQEMRWIVHIVHLGQTRTTAKTISCALACLRSSHAYSVTFDNGKEFSEHRRITDAGIETYFADPYKSIQRARNENTNGLIRQYLPKSSSFDHVSKERIEQIETALNNRPRKTLGWYTPSDIMAGFYTVALAAWIRQTIKNPDILSGFFIVRSVVAAVRSWCLNLLLLFFVPEHPVPI